MAFRPRQLSRFGTFYLQEAVLDVLFEYFSEDYGIGAAEISRRAGIYRDRGPSDILNDAIITGVLNSLHEQGKVERTQRQRNGRRGGWRLSRQEYNNRREEA